MRQIQAELIRKNNISAYWFLATAIFSLLILIFLAFVFILIFGSIDAVFQNSGVNPDSVFRAADLWQFYLAFFICLLVIISQFAAFGLIKMRSRFGQAAGITSFVLTLIVFTPLALLLIYPFAFLVGNDGKYIYQNLSKTNLSENNLQ